MGCAASSQAASVHTTPQPHRHTTAKQGSSTRPASIDHSCTPTASGSDTGSSSSGSQRHLAALAIDRLHKDGSFATNFRMGKTLGKGAFAVVNECKNKRNGVSLAVKVVALEHLPPRETAALKYEVELLRELQHPNIVCLLDVYQEENYYYLVMEKVVGGELFSRIVKRDHYNEKQARDTCVVLFKAVQYCHANNVVHRDLKPENLLLLNEESDTEVKLADFGFAKKALTPNSLTTRCGTPEYVAPEVIAGTPYDTQADMWSMGVIIYIMLGGYAPFDGATHKELFRKIKTGDYQFHEDKPWGSVSEDAKDLVAGLLTVNPNKRLSATEALEHKWIKSRDSVLASTDLGSSLFELRIFNAKRKFRAAVSTVIAANRLAQVHMGPPDFEVAKQCCEC